MAEAGKALLVAAGIGTRLRPLTDVLPKCLMPINGRPLLGIWLKLLSDAGFGEIIVNTHHHADLVREFVRRSPYSRHVHLAHEENLLGTGGTLLAHRERLAGSSVLFAHADNLSCFDPGRFRRDHEGRPAKAAMTMMTFATDAPSECGIVELDNLGLVTSFHEKVANPPGNLANAAVYLLEPDILRFIESLGRSHVDFSKDVIPQFAGRISAWHNDRFHRDIGTLESLAIAQFEYPLVDPPQAAAGEDDPWFGLMDGRQHDLAAAFRRAVGLAYAGVRPR